MTSSQEMRSSALSAEKMQNDDAFSYYKEGMIKNSEPKAHSITRHFPTNLEPGSLVLDLGTCSGALVHEMNLLRPDLKYIGIDLSHNMLLDAIHRSPHATFLEADALHIPIRPNSVSVITMSSILHEIFSYAGSRFTHDAVTHSLRDAMRLLQDNGRLIIKDPAKPENPDELLVFSLPTSDGHDHQGQDLFTAHPSQLSTRAKYQRFLAEFQAFNYDQDQDVQQLSINTDASLYRAPAWVLSEFLRHRNLDRSPEIWSSEMREMYGVFTAGEAKNALLEAGFTNIRVESSFNPSSHAAIKDGGIKIWSLNGAPVEQARRLPTGVMIVADKPRLQ